MIICKNSVKIGSCKYKGEMILSDNAYRLLPQQYIDLFYKNKSLLTWRQFLEISQQDLTIDPKTNLFRIFRCLFFASKYDHETFEDHDPFPKDYNFKSLDSVARSIAFFLPKDFYWDSQSKFLVLTDEAIKEGEEYSGRLSNASDAPGLEFQDWLDSKVIGPPKIYKSCIVYYVARENYYYQIYKFLYKRIERYKKD